MGKVEDQNPGQSTFRILEDEKDPMEEVEKELLLSGLTVQEQTCR